MNEFRILSIDELDEEFVTKLRVAVSVPKAESLKPDFKESEEISSVSLNVPLNEPTEKEDKTANIINNYLSADLKPVADKLTVDDTNEPRPIIPLGQGKAFYVPTDENVDSSVKIISEDDFEEEKPVKKRKGNKGLIAAKIACIIMLVFTLLIFIAGCFISIFLNNDGVDLNGFCFNTLVSDVNLSGKELKEGDLIISRKADYNEFANNLNKPIAIPVEGVENEGCEIEYIYSVSNIIDDETSIVTYDPETNEISNNKYVGDLTYGIVERYFPFVGGALVFALNNAVLICILFVLMAAFWCLLMILIEKNSKKKKEESII